MRFGLTLDCLAVYAADKPTLPELPRMVDARAPEARSAIGMLKYRDYAFQLSWGNGTHNGYGGSTEVAEEMIWMSREYASSRTEQAYLPDPAEKGKPMYRIKALNRE